MNLPRLEWLLETSKRELQELELASLNRSQRAIKTARLEWEEALAQRSVAEVARWLIENREAMLEMGRRTIDQQEVLVFPERKSA